MTYTFTDDLQVEEFSHFDYVEEMNESIYETDQDDWLFYEDDQDLEAYSLECAFGPEE